MTRTFLDNFIALVQSYLFRLPNQECLVFSLFLREFYILKAKEKIRFIVWGLEIGKGHSDDCSQ